MARDDDPPVEWLDLDGLPGADAPATPTRQRWPRWTPIVLLVIVALVVTAVISKRHHASPSAATTSRPPASTHSSSSAPAPSHTRTPPPVVVTDVGHPLLGVSAGWELFGRGSDSVVDIKLATGRIVRTSVPGLGSGGGVSFVVGADRAIVRPLGFVPGYVVPDGKPVAELRSALDQGGQALPGPDLNHVWVESGIPGPDSMKLTDLDGKPTGVSIPIPQEFGDVVADGTGYLVVSGVGGAYEARPDGLHRITTGRVLAIGPTRWLTYECDEFAQCKAVAVDRAGGARQVLGGNRYLGAADGVISPDGSTAALLLFDPAASGSLSLHLVDLHSGADHRISLTVAADNPGGHVVWSPDSRWVFVSSIGEQVSAVDAHDRSVHDLGVHLPPVSQLAIRPARR